jgi:hypothetical protein
MTLKFYPERTRQPDDAIEHRRFSDQEIRPSRDADEEHRIIRTGGPGIRASHRIEELAET